MHSMGSTLYDCLVHMIKLELHASLPTCLLASPFLLLFTASTPHSPPGMHNATGAGSRQLTSIAALHEVGDADSASMVKEKIAGVLTQELQHIIAWWEGC